MIRVCLNVCLVAALMFVSVPVSASDVATAKSDATTSDHGIALDEMGLSSLDVESTTARSVRGQGMKLRAWSNFANFVAYYVLPPGTAFAGGYSYAHK